MDETFNRYVVPRTIRDLIDTQEDAPRSRTKRRRVRVRTKP